jgi:hypothetical protein
MKKTNVVSGLAVAAAAVIFTGCSSMNGDKVTSVEHPNNAVASTLAFVPSTDPKVLTTWPQEWGIQSIDTYTFVVPDKTASASASTPAFSADLKPGSVFVEAAGADRPARTAEVVRYAPSSH